ncbi:MAG: phospholipid carrier-dependent glycosyltransferase [Clostridia bacterium]|nr:phospholipid carrier-dependent glycosyltransferase [Clostridia bacterium]
MSKEVKSRESRDLRLKREEVNQNPTVKNSGKIKMVDIKDIFIMIIMSLVFFGVAVFGLGSREVPATAWNPAKAGESFVVDFEKERNIAGVYLYFGMQEGEDNKSYNGVYNLEYADHEGSFKSFTTVQKRKLYGWQYVVPQNMEAVKTKRMKITVESPGGMMHEMVFMEEDYSKPVKEFKVVESKLEKEDLGAVTNLFDEQSTLKNPAYPAQNMYFDEIWHARTAYEYIHGLEPAEKTHPPLGKLMISIGIGMFGMNPFGWRIAGVLFGALMIPLMYLFGKKIFKKRFYAFCTAFLMMFDFMLFVQSRIGTVDVFMVFFILAMYYCIYDFYQKKSYEVGIKNTLQPLFLTGIFLGLGVSCKWISAFGAVGIILLIILAKYHELRDYYAAKAGYNLGKGYIGSISQMIQKSKKVNQEMVIKKYPWVQNYMQSNVKKTVLGILLFLIVLPSIIYFLSYIPILLKYESGFKGFFESQSYMLGYHAGTSEVHQFSSPWWSWPFMTTPLGLTSRGDIPYGKALSIVDMGNPLIWWVGIIAVIATVFLVIKKGDKRMMPIITAFAFLYIPWAFVPRVIFIYHFFACVPFMILCIVYIIKQLCDKIPSARKGVYGYLAAIFLLFILFYPIISGTMVDKSYIDTYLRWFKDSWIFYMG